MSRPQIVPKAPPRRPGTAGAGATTSSSSLSTSSSLASTSSITAGAVSSLSSPSSQTGDLFNSNSLGDVSQSVAAPSSIFGTSAPLDSLGVFSSLDQHAFSSQAASTEVISSSSSSSSSSGYPFMRNQSIGMSSSSSSIKALRQPTPGSGMSGISSAASHAASISQSAGYSLDELAANPVGVMEALMKSGVIPVIQNVVSTFDVRCELDLREIAMKARNAEYNPKRFIALIMRLREPKTTALIFKSGKIVVTGARSERDSRIAGRKFARILQNVGYTDVRFTDFTIRNVVASADVKFPIRLEQLVRDHDQWASYEPELFPALIYRMVMPKVVFMVFVSGKVIITGAQTRADVYTAFEQLFHVLWTHKKSDPVTLLTE